ncbi:MAG: S1 RNA-binding domain-containing protein [Mycoplasmataceae bacterium]|jgi:predicted RNA-binding protein with RPS1 domain|nr:S1 RNA-binding domain-containing protein [Mycoplasmataceae bacterium]
MIDTKNIVNGKVIRIMPTFAIILFDQHLGICHISEISDYHVNDIKSYLLLEQTYSFLLIDVDAKNDKYRLSFKRIRPKLLKHHREIIPSVSGFKQLYDQTLKILNEESFRS